MSSSWNLSKPLIKTVLSAPGLGFGVKPLFSLCHRKFDNLTVSYLYMKPYHYNTNEKTLAIANLPMKMRNCNSWGTVASKLVYCPQQASVSSMTCMLSCKIWCSKDKVKHHSSAFVVSRKIDKTTEKFMTYTGEFQFFPALCDLSSRSRATSQWTSLPSKYCPFNSNACKEQEQSSGMLQTRHSTEAHACHQLKDRKSKNQQA